MSIPRSEESANYFLSEVLVNMRKKQIRSIERFVKQT